MRTVIIEFISLDGVVQAPGGPDEDTDGGFAHGGWSHPFFDETVGGGFDDALTGAEALLFGRRTWQTMAAAWPGRAGDPFADRMNAIPKYVVSATLRDEELAWANTTRIPGGEAVARIRELREAKGGDLLVMGSPTLARTLLHEGLVDELRLMIEPVLLGGGKTIFPADGALRAFELVSTVTSGTGVQVCTYRTGRGEAHMNATESEGPDQGAWPEAIAAITLFVEDLEAAKRFYREVFELPVVFEDDSSTVFRFGETLVNLLQASEAPGLVEPATVAGRDTGVRFQLTLGVDDVDATCAKLKERGVDLLNGPIDRPWGIRTASFRDPGGHIWEIAR